MEKVKKIIADHPVAAGAAVTIGLLWAYHNGYLNAVFANPAKFVLVESTGATSAALTNTENSNK